MQKNDILVTGSNGFIGKAVTSFFRGKGFSVTGVDITNDSEDTYVIDLANDYIDDMLRFVNPKIIIHCAGSANVPFSIDNPERDFELNTYILLRLFWALIRCNMKDVRFVFMSSAAVYGQPDSLPITEETNLNPMSPYALHKKMSEDICLYFFNRYGFDVRILRVFSVYGPGLTKQVLWDWYQKYKREGSLVILGTGNESRDYIYIDDFLEALYLIITDAKQRHLIWNVASGEETTIRELARVFSDIYKLSHNLVKFSGTLQEGYPSNWKADVSRLKSIGFATKIGISDGVSKYVDWIEAYELDNRMHS